MKKYCEECKREVETKIITKKEIYTVYGEQIEVDAKILVCTNCGEEFFNEELDNETLKNVYDNYRMKHKLLFPDEIKSIREQYGLSQRSFGKLLNWGDKTINRYENGSIQDKAHNSILLFLKDVTNMKTYLENNEVLLEAKQKNKLLHTIEKLERSSQSQINEKVFDVYFSKIPCEDNGFKGFDYDKLCAMVLYFANRDDQLLKTKLMKLLNYSDMVFYKENGVSMSGLKYVHFPYGPVPQHFEMLFAKMSEDHIIHVEVNYENGYEKHQIVAEKGFDNQILTDHEMALLDQIYHKFLNYSSKEISDYSHMEKGYSSTSKGEVISYSYAKYIDLNK